ncbi:MAG: GntR family transcriptional regulator [Lachnospiraceae bacterium]
MIELDYKDRRPIYEQVTEKLASMMMLGVLEENSQLPSVRSMAVALSINPNTIQRAYAELERQGYIYSVKGKGSFVTDTSKMRAFRQKEARKKVTEAASEAVRLGLSEQEILEAAKEGMKQTGGKEYD